MIVGLTGGIGTGKSTVAKMFVEEGAIVISADALGHKAMAQGTDLYVGILYAFGEVVHNLTLPNGDINRKALGAHVFRNDSELEELDSMVHPVVREMVREQIRQYSEDAIVIYECAILFETEAHLDFDDIIPGGMTHIISTWCDEETQYQRTMARDNVSREDVLLRMERQFPAIHKVDASDFDIDTTDMEYARQRVKYIYSALQQLIPIRKQVCKILANARTIGNYPDLRK